MKEQFMILLHYAKIQKRFFDAFYNNWKVTETPGMVKDAKLLGQVILRPISA